MPTYGHTDVDRSVDAVKFFKKLRRKTVQLTMELDQLVKSGAEMAHQVDVAWAARECAKLLDDMRKEFSKVQRAAEQAACVQWLHTQTDGSEVADALGFIAQGSPHEGFGANVPERGSPEYNTFLGFLGATKEQLEQDVLRPHWPHVCDLIDARLGDGKPLPPGLNPDLKYPRYYVKSLRLRKGVHIGDDNNGEATASNPEGGAGRDGVEADVPW